MDFQNIKLFALFFEGLLSFISPCIIPIIPIYLSMLAGKKELNNNGELVVNKKRMLLNSSFFISGISLTFFLLAFASSSLSIFFNNNIKLLQTISGILIIFMGIVQLGIIKLPALKREFSMKNKLKAKKVTPFVAFLMGFTFSFSWTPCIGPIMASVFLYASSHSGIMSYLLILVYCLGFLLPFIILAFFASNFLKLLKRKPHILSYAIILSGILLIIIGISILTGDFHQIVLKYFN